MSDVRICTTTDGAHRCQNLKYECLHLQKYNRKENGPVYSTDGSVKLLQHNRKSERLVRSSSANEERIARDVSWFRTHELLFFLLAAFSFIYLPLYIAYSVFLFLKFDLFTVVLSCLSKCQTVQKHKVVCQNKHL